MPDSTQIQDAVRKAVAVVTGLVLSMVLLTALLLTGFYLLIQASIIGLAPHIGQAAAMAVVGAACMLLLIVFFRRMTASKRPTQRKDSQATGAMPGLGSLRELIRENPLESAFTAFAFGFAHETDPRLKSLLLQGGMELMKRPSPEGPSNGGSQSSASHSSESEETSGH